MPHDVKAGDQAFLEWRVGRSLADATTVMVHVAKKPGDTPIVSRAGAVSETDPYLVSITLTSTESDNAGVWFVELEATWPNGDVITFPAKGYELLRIHPELA